MVRVGPYSAGYPPYLPYATLYDIYGNPYGSKAEYESCEIGSEVDPRYARFPTCLTAPGI